ncbi:MAG: signal recognition particle-docking protein FtsY [candidate division WOR-3 bacterium]|nr:signal recognition particle-docking protein FtsY [candidate division WOR-3 bacterium]MCX7836721.1 signal recognition particle-docking protein FtsY [candidate division WOR-3 bacterium]MDW8113442.1 signal recognition particle-docking protein FtsY [candidate division WOR-3 bacterium]
MSIWEKLKNTLKKTKEKFKRIFLSENLEELEEALLSADIGTQLTQKLIEKSKKFGGNKKEFLKEELINILSIPYKERFFSLPKVVLVIGVNGTGKTTTVGKLAYYYKNRNHNVIIASADTYRDAATEQLKVWAEKIGVEIILSQKGQDAAAVVFDTIQSAQKRKKDIVLVDTAGRLHTRKELIEELKKIVKVVNKIKNSEPEEIFLIIDATVGQNGIEQAKIFKEEIGVTGIIVTKLDGTAKGGILIPIAYELKLPICYVGCGENIDDLIPFSPQDFVKAILED